VHTVFKKANGFQILFHILFFLIRDGLQGEAVGTAIHTQELHDSLPAHDIAPVFSQDLENLMRLMLKLAALFHFFVPVRLTHFPVKTETMVIGSTHS
jgi:hypothetical protein